MPEALAANWLAMEKMNKPIEFGDAQNVVAVLHLSRESLEDIACQFSVDDSFSKECWAVIEQLDKAKLGEKSDA